jgi:hypothetical protein
MEYLISEHGTAFHQDTPREVREVLDRCINSRRGMRVRIWLGDTKSGKAWNGQEHDVIGYIGRSSGTYKIPLMVYNTRALGGGGILDHCIIKITCGRSVLYQHPQFSQPVYTAEGGQVMEDGMPYAPNCATQARAERLAAFMNGERNSK